MKNLMLVVCLAIAAALIVGCGVSKVDSAKADVQKMLDHIKAGEIDEAVEYMDFQPMIDEMKKQMEGMDEETKKMMGDMADPDKMVEMMKKEMKKEFEKKKFDYEILSSEEYGEDAVKVVVQMKEEGKDTEKVPFVVVQKDGKWKVDLMATEKAGKEEEAPAETPAEAPAETPAE